MKIKRNNKKEIRLQNDEKNERNFLIIKFLFFATFTFESEVLVSDLLM